MRTRRYALMGLVVAAAMCWAGTAEAVPPTAAQKCEATKFTAAGEKEKCLADEGAKVVKGLTPNYGRCDTAFMKAFATAETVAGLGVCQTENDAVAVEALIDGCFDDLQAALAGSPNPSTKLLATGQTTPFQAARNDGIVGPVAVNDDGTLKLGIPLRYADQGDGTVRDLNTGLLWEKKVEGSGCLHCVHDEAYRWSVSSEDGSQDSIWDWLDALNASNFAGHNDWRIPNVRDLHSIVHYGVASPALDPVFGPSAVAYWSSTTVGGSSGSSDAYYVDFDFGDVRHEFKPSGNAVRAVRGGL